MHTLIFDKRSITLEYENQCLLVRQPEAAPRSIPLRHINKIICLHSIQLTTQLLGQLWERGITFVTLNNRYAKRSFAITPNQHNQIARRCVQYQWQQSENLCLPIAKEICRHRIAANLKIIKDDSALLESLRNSRRIMLYCSTLNKLRGAEGIAQRNIFNYWRQKLPQKLNFTKRQKHPAPDPVNALLSLTYTLVYQEAIRQCIAAGLDSQLGFYHRTNFGRDSLACDIMEPVRPFCEQWVFEQFINGTFNLNHFTKPTSTQTPCLMGKQGRTIFYQNIDAPMKLWQRKLQANARWLSRKIDQNTLSNNEVTYA